MKMISGPSYLQKNLNSACSFKRLIKVSLIKELKKKIKFGNFISKNKG